MKTIQILLAAMVVGLMIASSQPAKAALYTFTGPGGVGTYASTGTSLSQVIPDNSPVGVGYGFNFTETGLSVGSLVLTFNMSGGYNGDMYGYLQHGGTLIELFNPSSFSAGGAAGSTLNISLATGSNPSLSGATAADLASGTMTYAASGNLNGFVGADPNGLWTLFFGDQSAGDKMMLNSFNLSITAVPEPVNLAIVIFWAGFIGVGAVRCYRLSCKARR
jgi:hypothetical protein